MNVFAIGGEIRTKELKALYNQIETAEDFTEISDKIKAGDAVIHFWESESIDDLQALLANREIHILINTLNTSLSELKVFLGTVNSNVMGFAGIPGFINRNKWEITALDDHSIINSEELFKLLKVKPIRVQDRVGMVTPRVVSMIINEAYFTVMEGTAEKKDIDVAMKLGTNYPEGPFAWLDKIGIEHIYELLDALYEDTKEERYKICPLLKQEYLNSMSN
ncbi:MAG: 3-hydroxyacyl-CoA dehydrogenase family protein [Cytophagales bacterium]